VAAVKKSHFFAGLIVAEGVRERGDNGGEGMRVVCIREMLRDLKESANLIEDEGDLQASR
jgi:phage terminase large subunit